MQAWFGGPFQYDLGGGESRHRLTTKPILTRRAYTLKTNSGYDMQNLQHNIKRASG